ncbi:MAG: cation-translocating P-type ATPase, partial [Candidatus Sericytochromatia bacterium]|nr:cation-translocating P-type ATPase [Candidatus Tanganyikabacteria bacterium]
DRAGAWGAIAMVALAALAAVVGGPNAATAALLVFCPCALGLAVPAALAAAGATGVRQGFLVLDGAAFERLAEVDCVVVDKTGTVTEGELALVDFLAPGSAGVSPAPRAPLALDPHDPLLLAAALAAGSAHPVSLAIRRAAADLLDIPPAEEILVEPGCGVSGVLAGRRLRLGRPEWAAPGAVPPHLEATGRTLAALGDPSGRPLAWLVLADRPDPAAVGAVAALRAAGLRVVMASGDREAVARQVAADLGIAEAAGAMGPPDKLALVRRLAAEGATVAMLGDGINDAPALGAAAVGVAMSRGAAVARDAAGLVLTGGIAAFPRALAAARRARRAVWQNLAVAALYNVVAVPGALLGLVSPLMAALLMPLSSLLVLGNALRMVRNR